MVSKKINKKNIESKAVQFSDMDEVVTVSKLNRILDERGFLTKDHLRQAFEDYGIATKSYVTEEAGKQRKDYERYMGALVEDFNDKVKSLGEGISMILERGAEDSEKNRREHEWFKMKIARLDAKVF